MHTTELTKIKANFTQGLSQISQCLGLPKSMGAIFAVLYLSPSALSLDEIVEETSFTKGAISTSVRTLARMGLVHRQTKLGDRKDYYLAEDDFYKVIRSILKGRENSEFSRAIDSFTDNASSTLKHISSPRYLYFHATNLPDAFFRAAHRVKLIIRTSSHQLHLGSVPRRQQKHR